MIVITKEMKAKKREDKVQGWHLKVKYRSKSKHDNQNPMECLDVLDLFNTEWSSKLLLGKSILKGIVSSQ